MQPSKQQLIITGSLASSSASSDTPYTLICHGLCLKEEG